MPIPSELIEQAQKLASAHYKEIELGARQTKVRNEGMIKKSSLKHSLYWDTIALAKEISAHYVWGADPGDLIKKARPYEPEQIEKYREDAYEQETFPHGQRILGLVKGALSHPQLFSIDFPPPPIGADSKGERIQDYVFSGMPIGNIENLNTYFWEFIFQMAMVDPNGWVAVLQKTSDFELFEDSDKFRDPYPEFIPSGHVLDYNNDYCLVLSTEKVQYDEGKEANCFYFFTLDVTFKCIPFAGRDGVEYEALVWHEHYYNELQIRQAGGLISGVKNSVLENSPQSFHLSHLQPTIPAFNKAVRYLSDLDATFVTHMHPIKVEEMIACGDCFSGRKQDGEVCGSCNGSGRVSPGNSVLSGYTKAANPQTGKIESPVLYISPDPAIFKEARAFVEEKIREAYEGVNAAFLIKKSGGQNEAARSRELNREPLLLYFRQVAGTVFPIYQWILDMVNRIRYEGVLGDKYVENRPVIIEPANYDTSVLDLVIDELVKIKQTDIPASVVNLFTQNAIKKRFGAESTQAKLMNTYLQVDLYSTYTEDELLVLSTTQNLDPIKQYIHANVVSLVDECLSENPDFLELTDSEKRDIVYEKARVKSGQD